MKLFKIFLKSNDKNKADDHFWFPKIYQKSFNGTLEDFF